MALRDALRNSAAQFVQPGEEIQQVFWAQTASTWTAALGAFGALGGLVRIFINRYRIVAVTDQRILVLDAGKWSVKTARSVVTTLPRATRLGPASGLWHTIDTGSEKIRVPRRFFNDIAAADSAITPITY
jgi:hypothetical protein